MPSDAVMEELEEWVRAIHAGRQKARVSQIGKPSVWVYNTCTRSTIDRREFHVWERMHKEGFMVYALTPLNALDANRIPQPPHNTCGCYTSLQALAKLTGVDIIGRE